jgi:ureidoacrylate peracid hydrolase
MNKVSYEKESTALLVIDPYNDFISQGGKLWDRVKAVAEANQCVPHMMQVLAAARKAKLRVFYALHRRYRPGDYETWKYIAPVQKAAWGRKTFEYGTWGGEIRAEFEPKPGDIIAAEHWCSSGFANTDLDLQLKIRSMASISSLSSGLSRIPASRRPFAMQPSLATRSQW